CAIRFDGQLAQLVAIAIPESDGVAGGIGLVNPVAVSIDAEARQNEIVIHIGDIILQRAAGAAVFRERDSFIARAHNVVIGAGDIDGDDLLAIGAMFVGHARDEGLGLDFAVVQRLRSGAAVVERIGPRAGAGREAG